MQMWPLGTCFSGGLSSAGFMVGPNNLKGPFQPIQFYDSILKSLKMLFLYTLIT